jgi:hypothetical protein
MMTKEEVAAWVADHRDTPVWRDGLTSTLTYLIVAVHRKFELYNCVCVRELGNGVYNVKFYPTFEQWGLTPERLTELGANEYTFLGRSEQGYERVHMDKNALERVLDRLQEARNVTAVTIDLAMLAFRSGAGRQDSVRIHPQRGGKRATVPFIIKEQA